MGQTLTMNYQFHYDKQLKAKTPLIPVSTATNAREYKTEIREQHTIKFITLTELKQVEYDERIVKEFIIYQRKNIPLMENKSLVNGHISKNKNLKAKVGALAMSIQIPTPFLMYQKELSETFKEGLFFKLAFSGVGGFLLSLGGFTNQQIITGVSLFFLIALFDAILGKMPNTVKGSRTDHKLQVKAWMFVTNMIALMAVMTFHMFITNLIPDPKGLEYIPVNIHYVGIVYIISPYFYRMTKYIAVANKTKVPKFINNLFKR